MSAQVFIHLDNTTNLTIRGQKAWTTRHTVAAYLRGSGTEIVGSPNPGRDIVPQCHISTNCPQTVESVTSGNFVFLRTYATFWATLLRRSPARNLDTLVPLCYCRGVPKVHRTSAGVVMADASGGGTRFSDAACVQRQDKGTCQGPDISRSLSMETSLSSRCSRLGYH